MIKSRHRSFAENLLFALNIFIIFLLVFGTSVIIPQWLQPVGRLHPLILHFPIVVLIMAMMLEFFRFKERFRTETLYHDFTTYLWLTGAIFAAFTAIMGLFLSKEPGYEGATLQWHKWLGAGVVFVSTIIYWCRSAGWYNVKIARSCAALVVVSLVLAGHFGADLTHGENFVLAPVWHPEKELVPVEKALVYRDVIQPIFLSKCTSCHNPDKTKGGLMLIDEKSILKGGKDGKLFLAGQPQISMLLQRIHLPEEDKKHMPPSGKPQLTPDEMNLLYLWIKENADFKKKVIDLPEKDSLRLIAVTYLKPADETGEKYDFAAADEKLIKKLNNNYRVIYPLASESPALGVNVYNKSTYQPKTLQQLSAIKKQVVLLDVSKMPVKDAELKTIAQFENLHVLNLNFTDITGSTLKDLAGLKALKMLSLAGTPLNAGAIKQISAIRSLTKITLWDTGLSDAVLKELQSSNKNIEFIKSFKDDGKPIKLNDPQVKNTSLVFANSIPLQLVHPIKGVELRYTADGSTPDSLQSPIYKPGLDLTQTSSIKVKAYKNGWLSSDVVQFNVFKSAFTPDSISFLTPPNEKYTASGAKSLIDKELGGTNFGNGKWIAAQKNIEIYMQFANPVKLHTITLNCLRNLGSQVFLPIGIEIWGGADLNHLKRLSSIVPPQAKKGEPDMAVGIDCKLKVDGAISCIKIIAKNIQQLPSWDPVKKGPEWVFMDEIFVN
ncbi:c-type cytochrome domain-containing protein [Mucilaginibacter xinganensis]|uniref:Putative membrane protein n=1 Tax=Mucilaginibacter xinganensis TaxID=1234841 RepID=A0A223NRG7_9SPHI|nr:c-type cytochrome domain-containing protein [Mucilaginibacter xinganensis]ASU32396.1 putative membrane protein [Mucilaginibacter xinganensis]